MAATAFQIQYRQEYIPAFERRQTLLRNSVTTESVISGNQATFLVAGSGGATAKNRGIDGRIPSRNDDLNQPVATLVEKHDKVEKSGFNIFAGQGDQRRIMQDSTMAVLNRSVDAQILTALSGSTLTQGAAATASLDMFTRSLAILGANDAAAGEICAAISPGARAYLLRQAAFTSADFYRKDLEYSEMMNTFRWSGINFVVHTGLDGAGSASETMYVYNKAAVGHAMDIKGMNVDADYEREDDYSWARASAYMGGVLLQNSGVVKILHDSSALTAV